MNGEIKIDEITKAPTHEELHEIVGGWIEMVPFFTKFGDTPCVAYCNEEGKIRGLSQNQVATMYWRRVCSGYPDILVGDVAIVTGPKSFLNTL